VLAALFVSGATSLDGFAGASSIRTMLVLASLVGIAALGQTLVVLLGGLDLSVPGFIALGNVAIAQLVGPDGWPFVPALVLVALLAAAGGALTGLICHRLSAPPLVVTLGSGSIAAGAVLVWTNGEIVTGALPGGLSRLTSPVEQTFGLGVPPIVAIWALLAVAAGVFLGRAVTGRRLYAAGANPVAARIARVPLGRLWAIAFALSALSSALTGVVLAGFSGGGDASVGNPYLFTSIAAVVVGGTAIGGGRGGYWRTVLGALTLTELTTILVAHGFGEADQQILFGLVILMVVPAYARDRRVRDGV
jgi:ribose transport system permease protein